MANKKIRTGYKGTETVLVPNDWESNPIKNISRTTSGGTPLRSNQEYYENGTIPWLKTGELKRKFIYDAEEKITEKAIKETSAKIIPRNAVIIAMYGATIGKLSITKSEVATNQACCAIIPEQEVFDYEYLYYALLFNKERLISLGAGGAQPNISQQIIRDYYLLQPPLVQQQKIAKILSSLDNSIEKTESIIEKTEEVKKGLMQQLLTKGIGHTKFKQTEIGEIPDEWNLYLLGDVLEVAYGKNQSKVEVVMSDIPILGTGGVIGYSNKALYNKPSVLIGRKGTIDKPQYMEKPFWTIDTLFYTKINEELAIPKYIYYLFNTINWYRYNEATGVPSLSVKNISSIKVCLPNLKEQEKINNILTNIDNKIQIENEKLTSLNLIKKGLMQALLTGKKRVKVDEEEVTTSCQV